MDPRTGAILAMANAPTFDANRFSTAPADERRNRAVTRLQSGGLPLPLGELVAPRGHSSARSSRRSPAAGRCSRRELARPRLPPARGRHVFRGALVAAEGAAFGEVVFTTGMTGYQEIVTDPSYAGSSSASRRR